MSERKSWDIQPKNKAVDLRPAVRPAAAEPRSARRPEPVQAPARPVRARPAVQADAAARVPRANVLPAQPLKARRREKRKRVRVFLALLVLAVIGGIFYALWLPALRLTEVTASGPDADQVRASVLAQLEGRYAYVLPRNSVFLLHEDRLRAAVLASSPDVSAVSFTRTSFHSLGVSSTGRITTFLWCGASFDTPDQQGVCYDADAEGLIFSEDATASATPDNGTLRVFAPLTGTTTDNGYPLGARLVSAPAMPGAISFVKAVRALGVTVSSLAIRDDEADLWLQGPTRITYTLGQEDAAAATAAAVLPTLSLSDGSIQYVDLRFPGKAYIQKYGEEQTEAR